jgi:hypothetical protein
LLSGGRAWPAPFPVAQQLISTYFLLVACLAKFPGIITNNENPTAANNSYYYYHQNNDSASMSRVYVALMPAIGKYE